MAWAWAWAWARREWTWAVRHVIEDPESDPNQGCARHREDIGSASLASSCARHREDADRPSHGCDALGAPGLEDLVDLRRLHDQAAHQDRVRERLRHPERRGRRHLRSLCAPRPKLHGRAVRDIQCTQNTTVAVEMNECFCAGLGYAPSVRAGRAMCYFVRCRAQRRHKDRGRGAHRGRGSCLIKGTFDWNSTSSSAHSTGIPPIAPSSGCPRTGHSSGHEG